MKTNIVVIHDGRLGPISSMVIDSLRNEGKKLEGKDVPIDDFRYLISDIILAAEDNGKDLLFSGYGESEIFQIFNVYPEIRPHLFFQLGFNIYECWMEQDALKMKTIERFQATF